MLKHRVRLGLAAVLVSAGSAAADPDLIGGDITSSVLWGTTNNTSAYSFSAVHCNVGTSALNVDPGSTNHYLFTQNMYRYSVVNGAPRFEQLGQNWVFHSFCALQNGSCATCSPSCAGCCDTLGVGCSDSNSASSVGSQSNLGPRWQVNPWTGAFTLPHAVPGTGVLPGRVQVAVNDLDPALNPGALYFAELIEIAADDASAGNAFNNASYRRLSVGVPGGSGFPLTMSGTVVRQQPAMHAWLTNDPGVGLLISTISPSDGRFTIGSSATDLGNGTWRYEYAVFNLNSDRAARAFSVPVHPAVTLTNIGFHDVEYHSQGNPYSGTDWVATRAGGVLTWETEAFSVNPNANALRWGTMYNFRFDANVGPMQAELSLGLFKPGTPTSVTVTGMKAPAVPPPPQCAGDTNGDLVVNSADLSVVLSNFNDPASGASFGDFNGDGVCNAADLSVLLGAFGTSC